MRESKSQIFSPACVIGSLNTLQFGRRPLDTTALRNLEILEPLRSDSPRNACLFGALNRTVTPMGARRLREWLGCPLASVAAIARRRDSVQRLLDSGPRLEELRKELAEVRDLERTIGRLGAGSGNGLSLYP